VGAPIENNNPFFPLDGILQGGCHCRSAGCEQFKLKVIRFVHLFRGLHNAGTGVDSHNAALKFFFMVIEFRYFRNGDVVRHHPTSDGSLVIMPQIETWVGLYYEGFDYHRKQWLPYVEVCMSSIHNNNFSVYFTLPALKKRVLIILFIS